MNVTMNKFEDVDECKGRGSIRKISINSGIDGEAFHEVFQVQHISKVRMEEHMKDTISLSTPRRRQVFNPQERKILT